MSERLDRIAETLRNASSRIGSHLGHQVSHTLPRFRGRIIAVSLLAFAAYGLYSKPPMQSIGRGEIGIRVNQLTGNSTEVRDGAVLVIPGLHELRRFSLRDQVYRPTDNVSADGASPFQSGGRKSTKSWLPASMVFTWTPRASAKRAPRPSGSGRAMVT